ncbi:MAG: soluble lytic murein transglycosylase-like protein [Paracoccaceae bacterium]|jgi:soluble lytic murein transglycosylase-like protein
MYLYHKLGFVLLALTLGLALPANAQTSSSKSRTSISKFHAKLLDGRLSKQYEGSKRLQPTNSHIPRYSGAYKGEYLPMAEEAAVKFGVPKELFTRLVQAESNWNPTVISPAGAIGLAQLMPATAAILGVDPLDPKANLEGGALYLKQQYQRFGSWKLAIAAYNAGPEAVDRYDDVPPYPETQAYVLTILGQ